jgi:2,3-bisphosphoglycerate-independent phosphoglycerate mutase
MENAEEALGRGAGAGGPDLGLIMKWPSRAGTVEPFEERHGMRAAAVVSTPCFSGMAVLLSMRLERVGEGEAAVELAEKLRVAGDLLDEGWEFVFVHTKQADEAAHRGDPVAKKEIIEAMDGALAECGISWEDPDLLTVITADHSTPTARDPRIIHGGDPVPVLFHAVTARRDGLVGFDEVSAASGAMGQLRGRDLMPVILYLTRKAPFYTGS